VTIDATSKSASASKTIFVAQGELMAQIYGGSNQAVKANSSITIDGSSSFDRDSGLNTNLIFVWSCVQLSPVYNETCTNNFMHRPSASQKTFILTARESATVYSVSEVTLQIFNRNLTRSATTSIVLTLLPAVSPIVLLKSNAVNNIINPDQILRLTAQVYLSKGSCGNATWSSDDIEFDLSTASLSQIESKLNSTAANSAISSYMLYFAVSPNSMLDCSEKQYSGCCQQSTVARLF
jgi:hypothetical protein